MSPGVQDQPLQQKSTPLSVSPPNFNVFLFLWVWVWLCTCRVKVHSEPEEGIGSLRAGVRGSVRPDMGAGCRVLGAGFWVLSFLKAQCSFLATGLSLQA